jgi:hypothetical protein
MAHGICHRSQWWHDDLADAAYALWVLFIRHLDHDRFDHWQIGGNGHPVVEEGCIIQLAVRVVNKFLVQRPTDTLRRTTLDLALDIAWMDGPSDAATGHVSHGHISHVGDTGGIYYSPGGAEPYAWGVGSMERSFQVIPRRVADREREHFDIAGFLVGVVLSAAIGAVLYLYLL